MELVSAIVGVVIGFVLGIVAQVWFLSLSQRFSALDEHVRDILEARDLAVSHWGRSSKAADEKEMIAKVRGAMFAVTGFLDQADKILGSHNQHYPEMLTTFFNLATGGDFESKDRAKDPERIGQLFVCAAQLRLHVRSARTVLPFYK